MRGGFASDDFAGSLVEYLLVCAELLIGDERQVDPIGLVVADPAVLAFAGAALPGAERVAEERLQLEVGRQKLVLGHLLALVVREGLEQRRRETLQFAGEGIPQAGRVRDLVEEAVVGRAFHGYADGGPVRDSEIQVAFLVASDQSGFHLGRTLIDQRRILELALRGETPRRCDLRARRLRRRPAASSLRATT